VPVWNATIANLTLMALGSSAPEILLNLIETINTRGEPASELGPFTIVGSAAFNLLVITAASIVAVDDYPDGKQIADMGVFFTTAIFSLFAYFWLLIILTMNTPDVVSIYEAWLTFSFFFILVGIAYAADKYNQYRSERVKSEAEKAAGQQKQD